MKDIDKNKKKFNGDSYVSLEKNNQETEGVSTILGDPKKAILKFQPLIIAMILTSMNNLIDGVWIAGLGPTALAAVGFVTPMVAVVVGLASGLSNGAISVISRAIGAKNKKEADNTAIHIMIIVILFSFLVMGILGLFLKPLLLMLGAGSTVELALQYGYIYFGGAIFLVFVTAAYGILRAEGNIKKTIYAMLLAALLNMTLDPIFIYLLNMGIAGASIASLISWVVVSSIIIYWFKTDTFIDLSLKNFKYRLDIMKKILAVSLPGGSEFLIIAILVASLNSILVTVSGYGGVAVFTVGWNFILLAIVIVAPISISVIATSGASFGAKKYENLNIIQNFSIKIGILISVVLAITTFILAPYIAQLFTYSPETASLSGLISDFLRVMALFYIFIPVGSVATSLFLGVGKGLYSFILIIIRELLLIVVFAYILAIPLGFGQQGVWWGIVIGSMLGNSIAFIWSKLYIKKIITTNRLEQEISELDV